MKKNTTEYASVYPEADSNIKSNIYNLDLISNEKTLNSNTDEKPPSDIYNSLSIQNGRVEYVPYVLFTKKKEHLFFYIQQKDTNLISNIHTILRPLEIYGEIIQIDGVTLTKDQVEYYKFCSDFHNRETPLYKKYMDTYIYRKKHNIPEDIYKKSMEYKKEYYRNFLNNTIIASYKDMQKHYFANIEIYNSWQSVNEKGSTSDLYLLYNIPQKLCIVINEKDVSREMWIHIKDDFIVTEFPYISHFIEYFHMKTFESFDNLQKYIEIIENTLDVKIPEETVEKILENNKNEVDKIISYIKTNYELSDLMEPEYRKNTNDIIEELVKQELLNNKKLNNSRVISFILEGTGIKSKLFTEGYYYYGMVPKYLKYMNMDLSGINLEGLEETRNKEIEGLLNNLPLPQTMKISKQTDFKENQVILSLKKTKMDSSGYEHEDDYNEDNDYREIVNIGKGREMTLTLKGFKNKYPNFIPYDTNNIREVTNINDYVRDLEAKAKLDSSTQ
jgi:hypothetical protein